jgi:RNase P subunit RPR2
MKVQTASHQHKHTSVTLHAIRQRSGIPYEIERKVCSSCHRVLDEKPLRRAAA